MLQAERRVTLAQTVRTLAHVQVFTVTDNYRGDKFFVTESDVFKVTPLFVVLAVIEISDVIFAVDSIPAVFGVTLDPLVIYTSNMAAILSLRAMFGFVSTVIAELRCAPTTVAAIAPLPAQGAAEAAHCALHFAHCAHLHLCVCLARRQLCWKSLAAVEASRLQLPFAVKAVRHIAVRSRPGRQPLVALQQDDLGTGILTRRSLWY